MTEEQLLQLYREADAFLNVTASQELREEHMACPAGSTWNRILSPCRSRWPRAMSRPSRPLKPTTPFSPSARTLVPPIAVSPSIASPGFRRASPWPSSSGTTPIPPPPGRVQHITTWHNKGKNIEWRGETWYWTKDREFKKFLDLPKRRNVKFELALEVDDAIHRLLDENGWSVVRSLPVSRTSAGIGGTSSNPGENSPWRKTRWCGH